MPVLQIKFACSYWQGPELESWMIKPWTKKAINRENTWAAICLRSWVLIVSAQPWERWSLVSAGMTLLSGRLVVSLRDLVVNWSGWQPTGDRPLKPHSPKFSHLLKVTGVFHFSVGRRGSFREQMFLVMGHYFSKGRWCIHLERKVSQNLN